MASSPKKAGSPPARVPPAYVEPTPAPVFEAAPAPTFEPAPPLAPAPVFEAAPAFEPAPAPEVPALPVTASAAVVETAKAVEVPTHALHEIHDKTRSLFEKGIVESHARYVKAKTVANEASSAIEASVSAAKTGVLAFNVKAIESIKSRADANFDFLKSLFAAGSVSEYVTLHTEFARKQFETASAESKEFATLARKVADETVAPIKAQVVKTFKVAV